MKTMKRILILGLILTGIALPALAEDLVSDYSSYSLDELAALRGSLSESSDEEIAAFRDEWQSRILELAPEERTLYTGRPDGALAGGRGTHLDDALTSRTQARTMEEAGTTLRSRLQQGSSNESGSMTGMTGMTGGNGRRFGN